MKKPFWLSPSHQPRFPVALKQYLTLDAAVKTFTAGASNMSFNFIWEDLLYKNTKTGADFERDGKYSITLTNDKNKSIFSIVNSSLNDVAADIWLSDSDFQLSVSARAIF